MQAKITCMHKEEQTDQGKMTENQLTIIEKLIG